MDQQRETLVPCCHANCVCCGELNRVARVIRLPTVLNLFIAVEMQNWNVLTIYSGDKRDYLSHFVDLVLILAHYHSDFHRWCTVHDRSAVAKLSGLTVHCSRSLWL